MTRRTSMIAGWSKLWRRINICKLEELCKLSLEWI